MRVHIEQHPASMRYDIYFIEHGGNKSLIYHQHDGEWLPDEYDEMARDIEPSLTLHREMLEEFARAALGHVHAEEATVTHLKDAISNRDRLLGLIEKRGLR